MMESKKRSRRRHVISVLLTISSLSIGLLMAMTTAPVHEFGHYITAKSFGWNVTEVDWYSHIEYSKESVINASRPQRIVVSIAGVILAPIIPYILFVLVKRRSALWDILALPYLGHGLLASCADLKKAIWWLIISAPMTDYQVLSLTNLVVSILATIVVLIPLCTIVVDRYMECVRELSTVIDELDDHDVEAQKNEE